MGLRASMEEVALCFRFMDLLRQDLPADGEGMAEPSWCPLLLEGMGAMPVPDVPRPPPVPALPFMLPATGMPLIDSAEE